MPTASESVQAYVAAQNAADDQVDAQIQIVTSELTQTRADLLAIQNSGGTLSDADQASLDSALARTQKMADALKAVDAVQTPQAPRV
jgi:cell division septal protein FtsQ